MAALLTAKLKLRTKSFTLQSFYTILIKMNVTAIDYIKRSNRTARANGAVGNPLVAKWAKVNLSASPHYKILDFGSGPAMKQTLEMRALGFTIDAWDFGDNRREGMVRSLVQEAYDCVLASNVFNTHSNATMSKVALESIKKTLKKGGLLVLNMPASPVYFWKDKNAFFSLVNEVFGVPLNPVRGAKTLYSVLKM